MNLPTPTGMNRRHFLRHMATSAATVPALQFMSHLEANAATVKSNQKSCILMWMGGGPPTIDIWDLKPKSTNGGEFKPISTAGDFQITEALPETAKIMDNLSIVRSMSTREADHDRGRYYLHTSFVPNPTVVHPPFGSVISKELGDKRENLTIPSFVAVGGSPGSPGYLGMSHAPFNVDSNGQIRNANMEGLNPTQMASRLSMLKTVETQFIDSNRGSMSKDHQDIYRKALTLLYSDQMTAFEVAQEPAEVQEAYGDTGFGRGLLLARRLAERGVPFIEVDMGGWDLHQDVFSTLRDNRMPTVDKAMSTLVKDLKERGMLDNTVLVWMGEFGRTPRINQNTGRDHWARSWSVVIGGGGIKGGIAVGATDDEGIEVIGKGYQPGDIWATVAQAMGVPVNTEYRSANGRPMKMVNTGQPITELI
ncbi:hypothetical protein Pla110_45670 [Polystyrenella longa]|uniref:DUF1501 domain-containing protein n=1 Tax=Polystyrenella longa TaxID=2528007 RepID=A0A518CUE1_9PLAN|nr:DUF1501 domain-containing protein [Polystyrenella longa]QDU82804.1 hypothetical protein Pla110_45670 [Polystyrenella longa]